MLAEERLAVILENVQQKRSVKVSELCNLLNASVSTVRRDISTLAEMGKLTKVHGGAIALSENFAAVEKDMKEKAHLFLKEKQAVAQYAASLLEDGDFVFLDAGTTTENMIGFLPKKDICFVTNGLFHAKKLAQRGFRVYIPGGEIKCSTEAIVGAECACTVARYHFTKSFLGTNGVSVSAGFSTHDVNEAQIKSAAIENSIQAFLLTDHSKFDQITSVTFAQLSQAQIITDRLPDAKYRSFTTVKEVL